MERRVIGGVVTAIFGVFATIWIVIALNNQISIKADVGGNHYELIIRPSSSTFWPDLVVSHRLRTARDP